MSDKDYDALFHSEENSDEKQDPQNGSFEERMAAMMKEALQIAREAAEERVNSMTNMEALTELTKDLSMFIAIIEMTPTAMITKALEGVQEHIAKMEDSDYSPVGEYQEDSYQDKGKGNINLNDKGRAEALSRLLKLLLDDKIRVAQIKEAHGL